MNDELEKLIIYDAWANNVVFEALGEVEDLYTFPRMLSLFSHILVAQKIWYNRVMNIQEDLGFWPFYTLLECGQLVKTNPGKIKEILQKLGEVVTYKNSKGVQYTNSVADIVQHLAIHGQHHRAQIFSLLREAGVTPPQTDFIFWVRA